jgi:hypothetical protein
MRGKHAVTQLKQTHEIQAIIPQRRKKYGSYEKPGSDKLSGFLLQIWPIL